MALQFPNNPSLGEVYEGYAWQGSYWSRVATPSAESNSSANSNAAAACATATPVGGSNNTLINLTVPIDLGQLMHGADHAHSDFDYLAPE